MYSFFIDHAFVAVFKKLLSARNSKNYVLVFSRHFTASDIRQKPIIYFQFIFLHRYEVWTKVYIHMYIFCI